MNQQRLPAIFVAQRQLWLWLLILLGVAQAVFAVTSIWLVQSLWQTPMTAIKLTSLLSLVMGSFILQLCQHRIAERVAQNYLTQSREILYSHIMATNSDNLPSRLGVAMNRLITDTNSLKHWVGRGVGDAISQGLSLISLLCATTYFWPDVLYILILCLCISALITLLCRTRITALTLTIRQLRGRLSGHLCERTLAYSTVNSINQLPKETRQVVKNSTKLGAAMQQLTFPSGCLKLHSVVLSQLALVLLIINSDKPYSIDKNQLLPVLLVFGLFFSSLAYVNRASHDYFIFAVAKIRLNHALKNADASQPVKKNKLQRGVPLSVKCREVSYNEVFVKVNFTAKAGSTIALCGPSGSGKSLLAALISKQALPCSGQIVLNGRRLDWLEQQRLQQCVQLINTQSLLFKGTVLSNIRYGNRRVDTATLTKTAAQVGIAEHLLTHPVHELGRHVPSALRIRVLVARALLRKPGLLIIDDPRLLTDTQLLHYLFDKQNMANTTLIVIADQKPDLISFDDYWQLAPA